MSTQFGPATRETAPPMAAVPTVLPGEHRKVLLRDEPGGTTSMVGARRRRALGRRERLRQCSLRRCRAGRSSRSRAAPRRRASFEVGRDPWLVAAWRGDVAADRDAVHRLLVPRPPQHTPASTCAVGDDQMRTADLRPVIECHRSHTPDESCAPQPLSCRAASSHRHRRPPNNRSSSRCGRAARRRKRGPWPGDLHVGTNPDIRRPWWRIGVSHGPRPSNSSSATARGVSPSPQALSRGSARRRSPARRGRCGRPGGAAEPAGPAPITTTSARCTPPVCWSNEDTSDRSRAWTSVTPCSPPTFATGWRASRS
jgi:hypothetical protein